jgi:Ankyrin repeats (3 copies)/Ankyrin repeats (many copies)
MHKIHLILLALTFCLSADARLTSRVHHPAEPRYNDKLNPDLLYEVVAGDSDKADKLLQQGANPNAQDKNGNPALFVAICNNDIRMVKTLIGKGANCNATNPEFTSCLMQVVLNGSKKVPKTLEDGSNVFVELDSAINTFLADILISHNASLDYANKLGETALHIATLQKNEDAVKYLLANGANVDAIDINGQTPLCYAAKLGLSSICAALIACDANVNFKDKDSQTPLMFAVQANNPTTVHLLLSKGALADAQDDFGATPKKIAKMLGFEGIESILSSHSEPQMAKN